MSLNSVQLITIEFNNMSQHCMHHLTQRNTIMWSILFFNFAWLVIALALLYCSVRIDFNRVYFCYSADNATVLVCWHCFAHCRGLENWPTKDEMSDQYRNIYCKSLNLFTMCSFIIICFNQNTTVKMIRKVSIKRTSISINRWQDSK